MQWLKQESHSVLTKPNIFVKLKRVALNTGYIYIQYFFQLADTICVKDPVNLLELSAFRKFFMRLDYSQITSKSLNLSEYFARGFFSFPTSFNSPNIICLTHFTITQLVFSKLLFFLLYCIRILICQRKKQPSQTANIFCSIECLFVVHYGLMQINQPYTGYRSRVYLVRLLPG